MCLRFMKARKPVISKALHEWVSQYLNKAGKRISTRKKGESLSIVKIANRAHRVLAFSVSGKVTNNIQCIGANSIVNH